MIMKNEGSVLIHLNFGQNYWIEDWIEILDFFDSVLFIS